MEAMYMGIDQRYIFSMLVNRGKLSLSRIMWSLRYGHSINITNYFTIKVTNSCTYKSSNNSTTPYDSTYAASISSAFSISHSKAYHRPIGPSNPYTKYRAI
jgi:hypothetical protein